MWKSEFDIGGCCSYDLGAENMNAENIMKEIQRLYNTRKIGLKDAAKSIPSRSIQATTPRNKVTVLIVGNHNKAKQKFLDLYFSDSRHVADDGFVSRVNYDKLDKIYVTHGNRRRLLVGESVLDYCPHLSYLRNIPGVKDFLTTEIATRNTKSLVSFILAPEELSNTSSHSSVPKSDSAGLVDQNNNGLNIVTKKRSFDLRQAIGKLTEAADLIFVFFDPTGTVCPRETLKPFEQIWEAHHEKILFLLARAEVDESTDETRENVLTQIVREIWRNPVVRRVGYLPEIYCPDLCSGVRDDQRLWSVIQNSTDQSIEKALLQLEQDATGIRQKLEAIRKENNKTKENDCVFSSATFLVMALVVAGVCWGHVKDFMDNVKGQNALDIFAEFFQDKTFLASAIFFAFLFMAYSLFGHTNRPVLSDEEEKLLDRRIEFVNSALDRKKEMEKSFS